jgi:hypothetical protein
MGPLMILVCSVLNVNVIFITRGKMLNVNVKRQNHLHLAKKKMKLVASTYPDAQLELDSCFKFSW